MKLLKLKLTNFGIHKSWEGSLEAALLGLFGPNGSGKTSLINGLKFAITGNLPDNLTTYIHRYNPGESGQEAKVELWMSSGGRKIYVRRIIRPTANVHYLESEGMEKPLKKMAEVDQYLKELLGADKKAIESVVFIEQGDLKAILFGDRAEQEKLFARILLVSHLEQVTGRIDKEIKKLEASTVNQQPLIDELRSRLQENQERRDRWEATLNTIPEVTEELALLTSFINLRDSVSSAAVSVSETRSALESRKETLDATLASQGLKGIDELDQTKKDLETSESELERREKELLEMEPAAEAWESLKDLRTEVKTHTGVLVRNEEELAKLPQDIEEQLASTRRDKELLETLETETAHFNKTQDELKDAELKVQIFSKVPDINALQKDLDNIKELLSEKRQRLNLLQAISGEYSMKDCPLCKSDLSSSPLEITPEELDALQVSIMELGEKETATAKELEAARTKQVNLTTATRERDVAANSFQLAGETKSKAETAASGVSRTMEDLEAREKTLDEQVTQYKNLKSWVQASKESVATAERELKAATDRVGALSEGHDPEVYAAKRKEVSDLQKSVSSKRTTLRSVESALESYNTYKDRLEQQQLRKAKLTQELKEKTESEDPKTKAVRLRIDACRDEGVDEIQAAYDWYEEQASERKNVTARLQAEKDEIERTLKSLKEAESRQERDSVKIEVCEDLQRLKEAFRRDGIPSRYIAHRFFQLAELTQHNLAQLDANFTVEPDPDAPVSFLFTRTDQDYEYSMPQTKLSGGQSVRLSVAFLMSVQQLIVPDVGLLILDEPSQNLDSEGREGLRDLLRGMSASLQDADCQVIVSDHQVEVIDAVDNAIRLR